MAYCSVTGASGSGTFNLTYFYSPTCAGGPCPTITSVPSPTTTPSAFATLSPTATPTGTATGLCPAATGLPSTAGQIRFQLQGDPTYITTTPVCGTAHVYPNPQAYFEFTAPSSGTLQLWSCVNVTNTATGGAAYPNGVDTVSLIQSQSPLRSVVNN